MLLEYVSRHNKAILIFGQDIFPDYPRRAW